MQGERTRRLVSWLGSCALHSGLTPHLIVTSRTMTGGVSVAALILFVTERRASDWWPASARLKMEHQGTAGIVATRMLLSEVTCSNRWWAPGLSNYSWVGHRRAVQIRGWAFSWLSRRSALNTGGMSVRRNNRRWSPADGVRSSFRSEAASFKLLSACELPFLRGWDELSMRQKTTEARWRT